MTSISTLGLVDYRSDKERIAKTRNATRVAATQNAMALELQRQEFAQGHVHHVESQANAFVIEAQRPERAPRAAAAADRPAGAAALRAEFDSRWLVRRRERQHPRVRRPALDPAHSVSPPLSAPRRSWSSNSRRRTDAGEWVDGEPTFYPVTAWGEQGEHVAESLIKGARVVVLGTIHARSWAPTEGERAGETLTRLEVTAENVAASLQWATVTIAKAKRGDTWANAPVAADESGRKPSF